MRLQRKTLAAAGLLIAAAVAARVNYFQHEMQERLCMQEQPDAGIYAEVAGLTDENAVCRVYYLLDLDGMKGLGHSALMLVDEYGAGQVYSYNGMQYPLLQCLLGKAGIGKMLEIPLSEEEVRLFLETGEVGSGEEADCDDFDRTVYRYITKEQYEDIQECAKTYQETGDRYEELYAELYTESLDNAAAQEAMDAFLAQEDLPRYQIYHNNCDTVARKLLALADPNVERYNIQKAGSRPKGNFYRMYRMLDWNWGYRRLGEDSLKEKIQETL